VAYLAGTWLLIQILETLFPIFGFDERSIQVVVIALAIGFTPAVIIAWVFQVTPGGVVKDSGSVSETGGTAHAGFDRFIIVTLVLAVAFFAVHTFIIDPSRDVAEREAAREQGRSEALVKSFGDKSIAVLAFENMSSDPEQVFFADGIAEELLNLLARVEGLRVTSRTSAFKFRGTKETASEIAEQLNVNYVLEGSVRRSGDEIRITAQLIDARADMHIWSDTWDRKFEDVFAIQDEVAAQVVDELRIQMSVGMPKAERHDPAAYALFLQAQQLSKAASDNFETIESLLNRAKEIEPTYADVLVELSWLYNRLGDQAGDEDDSELRDKNWEKADKLLQTVASSDPDNVLLNVALAWNSLPDTRLAARYVDRALDVDPTKSEALNIAVVVLDRLWRPEEAVPIAQYVAERDPLFLYVQWNLARAEMNSGAFEAAEATYRTILTIQDDHLGAQWQLGVSLVLQGKLEAAEAQFRDHVADKALGLHGLVLALHELGRFDESRSALADLKASGGPIQWDGVSFLIATASAWVGNTDDAFEYFYKQRETWPGYIRVAANSPMYRNLRDDPRWLPFLRSVELDPEELAAVEFTPRLPATARWARRP